MDNALALFAILAMLFEISLCICPHHDPTLVSFASSYPNLQKSDEVVISDPVLLDKASVSVTKIIINGTGKLVFDQNINITVKTKGILIKDQGALIVGSADCRHEKYVNIVLEGERSAEQSQVGPEGEKYIVLQDNGQLKIHGLEKLSWTKLTNTVDRFGAFATDSTKVKYWHATSDHAGRKTRREGPTMYIVDKSAAILSYRIYDFHIPTDIAKEQIEVDKFIDTLNTIEKGQLVAISIQNFYRPSSSTNLTGLYSKLEEMAGMSEGELGLRNLEEFDAYALIIVKGSSYKQVTDKLISKPTTAALASIDFAGFKVSAVSKIDPKSKTNSDIDFRILDFSVGYPVIDVLDNVGSWNIGDEVLLTSTDYESSHGEVRKIKEILNEKASIRLSDELMYRHFGLIEDRIDMRAEVALLTRNIKIEGAMSRGCPSTNGNCDVMPFDTFGGNIKIMNSFGGVYLQGAEFTRMGQATSKGAYPINFQMLKNITDKEAVIESNSIHQTFQRCVAVQGTYGTSVDKPGVVIKNNVAYDVYGHCYFLESGAEAATILTGNLGANIKNINNGFFTTDNSGASVYWITDPKTQIIGNVAAGSEGYGIRYTFPKEPVGESAGLVYQPSEAFHTPLWTCDNNIVHSNLMGGFNFEKLLLDDNGNVGDNLTYSPLLDPLDSSSAAIKVQIVRLTAYKNRDINLFTTGGVEVMQISSAESRVGASMARGNSELEQYLRKSVFIGESTGNVELVDYPDAYYPERLVYQFGISVIDGPQYISDSWFTGFKPRISYGRTYLSGALSFQPNTEFSVSPLTSVYRLRFGFEDPTHGSKVFATSPYDANLGFMNADGNEQSTIRDIDGSLYVCIGEKFSTVRQLVKPEKFLVTSKCYSRYSWQLCVCDDLYGRVMVRAKDVFSGTLEDFEQEIQFKRISYWNFMDVAYEDNSATATNPSALLVLGDETYYYQMQYVRGFPKELNIELEGIESGKNVVIGLCLPEGTTSDELSLTAESGPNKWINEDFAWANSLQEVRDSDSMAAVLLDGRTLYVNFVLNETRELYYDTARCLSGVCPTITVAMAIDRPYTQCFYPPSSELAMDDVMYMVPAVTSMQEQKSPEPNWGVGDTTLPHDGAWGDWAAWSECQDGIRMRERVCDSPPKFGTGLECIGKSRRKQSC